VTVTADGNIDDFRHAVCQKFQLSNPPDCLEVHLENPFAAASATPPTPLDPRAALGSRTLGLQNGHTLHVTIQRPPPVPNGKAMDVIRMLQNLGIEFRIRGNELVTRIESEDPSTGKRHREPTKKDVVDKIVRMLKEFRVEHKTEDGKIVILYGESDEAEGDGKKMAGRPIMQRHGSYIGFCLSSAGVLLRFLQDLCASRRRTAPTCAAGIRRSTLSSTPRVMALSS